MHTHERLPYCLCTTEKPWKTFSEAPNITTAKCPNCQRVARYAYFGEEHAFVVPIAELYAFPTLASPYFYNVLLDALKYNQCSLRLAREEYDEEAHTRLCMRVKSSTVNHWTIGDEVERMAFIIDSARAYISDSGSWWRPNGYIQKLPPRGPSMVKVFYRSEIMDYTPLGHRPRWQEL